MQTQSSLLSQFPEIHQGTSDKSFGPLSFTYSKDTNKVIIDRVRFLDSLGLDASHSVLVCEQNHTSNVLIINDEHKVHGLFEQIFQLPDADGMVTNIHHINLIVYTADCMPISFYDPVKKVIGIAHSGWRGTLGGIGKTVLQTMQKHYGSSLQDIRVSVGPSIGPCCYYVSHPEQLKAFDTRYKNLVRRENKIYIDLWGSLEQDILGASIKKEHFENMKICTCCQRTLYASHRGDRPNTTANLTVISML